MTTINEVAKLYISLSQEIKAKYPSLSGWTFKWNTNLTNCMGRAVRKNNNTIKYIELSTRIVALNLRTPDFLNKIKQTIIHEWCHALDWEHDQQWGHGPTWRNWMMRFNLVPKWCFDSSLWLVPARGADYVIRNNTTGQVFKYFSYKPKDKDLTEAEAWHRIRLMRPIYEDLEMIHLHSGMSQIL